MSDIELSLDSLARTVNSITLYSAGLPRFPSIFSRDSILSAILMEDQKMLRDQLIYCALLQGTEKNPYSGEEPGKIFHEVPATIIRNMSTEFNACDTTALFIFGHEEYLRMTGDEDFISRQKKYLERAVGYILSHVVNNLFVEDPQLSGAKRFGLRVTYWKDSQIHCRNEGVPLYPAVFTLAHVQNIKALRSAANLLHAKDLREKAHAMVKSLGILYNDKKQAYNIGVDQQGFMIGVSSDNLHMLYYLEPDDLPEDRIPKLVASSHMLETPLGYRTLSPEDQYVDKLGTVEEGYHARTVWPFEQAFIHMGARKFELDTVQRVTERILPHLDTFPELFVIKKDGYRKGGTPTQLWTIAAKKYFIKYSSLSKTITETISL